MLTEITHDDNKVTWFTTESLTTLYKYSCGDYFVKNPGVAIVILFLEEFNLPLKDWFYKNWHSRFNYSARFFPYMSVPSYSLLSIPKWTLLACPSLRFTWYKFILLWKSSKIYRISNSACALDRPNDFADLLRSKGRMLLTPVFKKHPKAYLEDLHLDKSFTFSTGIVLTASHLHHATHWISRRNSIIAIFTGWSLAVGTAFCFE